MATKTYAELLAEVSITVTPNDAAFLAELLNKYMEDNQVWTGHLNALKNRLNGSRTIPCGCQNCDI